MTRQEFYEKYGNVNVIFASYYKYTFTYSAILPNGNLLTCGYGGTNEQIYRHEVVSGAGETINSLQPFEGYVFQDSKEIEGFYDF